MGQKMLGPGTHVEGKEEASGFWSLVPDPWLRYDLALGTVVMLGMNHRVKIFSFSLCNCIPNNQ